MAQTAFGKTIVPRKVIGTTTKEMFVPAINVGTVVLTKLVRTAVTTRVVGTATKEMFVSTIFVGTVVPTMIVGTAVPTITVLTAYYWKSCVNSSSYRGLARFARKTDSLKLVPDYNIQNTKYKQWKDRQWKKSKNLKSKYQIF